MIDDYNDYPVPDAVYKIIEATIDIEGRRYTQDPDDEPTNRGCVQQDLIDCEMQEVDLSCLGDAQANYIMRRKYWHRPKYYMLYELCPALSYKCFDYGLTTHWLHPNRALQKQLNALNYQDQYGLQLTVDGHIGLNTVNVLRAYLTHRGDMGEQALLFAMCASQLVYYRKTTEQHHDKRKYMYGWTTQRAMLFLHS